MLTSSNADPAFTKNGFSNCPTSDTHCSGHASNLAVADAIKSVQFISDSLDTVDEIGKLVKN